jgi:hypothetical protein
MTTPETPADEAPAEDLQEQTRPANPADEPVDEPVQVRLDDEVGEYDAVEQARVVDLDEDYR